jgi:unsaturated rhamnogalacturonyl hydrolase
VEPGFRHAIRFPAMAMYSSHTWAKSWTDMAWSSDHPTHPGYVDLFETMAARIARVQQDDGMWHASLLDPDAFSVPKSSPTRPFTTGLAVGSNSGNRNRAISLPVLVRIWERLVDCVDARGGLSVVQPVGHKSDQHKPSEISCYGVGAFLPARGQVYCLAGDPCLR